jgi:3-dehydroquinate synthase
MQVEVGLGERSYPIFIDKGVLTRIGADLKARKIAKRYAVISDETVSSLYAAHLLQSLRNAGIEVELLTFPAGEKNKNLQTVEALARELAEHGFDRKDALIALGGGVTGDITGFLASIYLRGIPFVQIPTTLLAQVDSSVGGKTGVDIPEGKNLIGTFYQPKVVYIDTDVLKTLPQSELQGGLAEVIKYGVIADADFFHFLEENHAGIFELRNEILVKMISRCCEIKAWVVEQDEQEAGLRRILNFGHTIGHAVEAASDFHLIHGLAVAIGMRVAADLAVRTGHLANENSAKIQELIVRYGLPISIPSDLDRDRIRTYLKRDKKTVGGRVFFVLPSTIGKVLITDQVGSDTLDAVLISD